MRKPESVMNNYYVFFSHPPSLHLHPRSKPNHQRPLFPQEKAFLVRPLVRWLVQLHIKIKDHASENYSHLNRR